MCGDISLMVSHMRLRRLSISGLPLSVDAPWVLDSGAFTTITRFGAFPDSPEAYVRAVRCYDARIGGLLWAAPQDMPCESQALAKTGLTTRDHQELSIISYITCTKWWERLAPARPNKFKPVIQGDTPESYVRCWDRFGDHGVDLTECDMIGVGSVCTREDTAEIIDIVAALRERTAAPLHGYGVKAAAVGLFDDIDSQSWSLTARKQRAKHPDCTAWHSTCSSCWVYASAWYERVQARHFAARSVLAHHN
jgi:hypothetical protein